VFRFGLLFIVLCRVFGISPSGIHGILRERRNWLINMLYVRHEFEDCKKVFLAELLVFGRLISAFGVVGVYSANCRPAEISFRLSAGNRRATEGMSRDVRVRDLREGVDTKAGGQNSGLLGSVSSSDMSESA